MGLIHVASYIANYIDECYVIARLAICSHKIAIAIVCYKHGYSYTLNILVHALIMFNYTSSYSYKRI